MRDAEPVEMAGHRGPGAHSRAGAWLHQINSGQGTCILPLAIPREVLFVRAPAELARLRPFAHEAIHRPGVDEFVGFLRDLRRLGIALRDMDDFDAEFARELAPLRPGPGIGAFDTSIRRDVEQSLFDEMRDETRIR